RRNANLGLDWIINDSNQLSFKFGFGRQDTEAQAGQASSRDYDLGVRTDRTRQIVRHKLDWGDNWTTKSYVQHEEVDIDSGPESTYERSMADTQTILPFMSHLITLGAHYRLQRIEHDPQRAQGKA